MRKTMKILNKVPFAPVVAVAFGLVTAALTFAIPAWRFAQMIVATGLPTVLSAAQPPLGDTARALVAINVGLAVCASLWIGLTFLRKLLKQMPTGQAKARGTRIDPVIMGTSTPKPQPAGKRSPIFAERDLGAPFMSDEVLSAQGYEAIQETTQQADAAAPDELVLESAWSEEVPPIVKAVPDLAPDNIPSSHIDKADVMPNQNLSDLIVRLDSAMEARSNRKAVNPSGDIHSLRTALDGLIDPRIAAVRR